jgi:predicted alpha/beta superfamily hydrolase
MLPTQTDPVPRTGTIETLAEVPSAVLGNVRPVYVYLPAAYADESRRFPVVYMQDGQNLFDPAQSFAGAWMAQESVEATRRRAEQAILVGIANRGRERLDEFSPFVDEGHGGGRGDEYLAFVAEELKPLIDATYRTRPEARRTAVVGSSMGGLFALYALFARPDGFGAAGALSPALWFAQGAIFDHIERAPFVGGRIHLDVGTMEGPNTALDARRMRDLLIAKGYEPGVDLQWIEEEGARHNEAAWGRRFHRALPFLLGVARPGR